MSQITLIAAPRELQGKGASRRLRHEAATPAIVYGANSTATAISLVTKDLVKALENVSIYSSVLALEIDGTTNSVVMKALQRHPVKNAPMHVDFLRVDDSTPITMRVPLIVKNVETCKGVKQQGGRLSILMNDVEITCLPKHLPSSVVVDIAGLEAGNAFLLADAVLPEGVSIPALAKPQNLNMPVAKVRKPRGGAVTK